MSSSQPIENLSPRRQTRTEPRDVPIAEYLGILWVRRLVIIAAAIAAGLLTFAYTSLLTPIYEAEVVLLVSQAKIGEQTPSSPLNVATFRSVIVNRALAAEVIGELDLMDPPTYRIFAPTRKLSPARFVDNYLRVEQIGAANLMRIRVQGPNPELAARVANRLVDKAVALNRALSQREVVAVRDYIKTQVDETSTRLEALQKRLLDYKEQSQVELLKKDAEAALIVRSELIKLLVDIEREKARLARGEEQLTKRQPTITVLRSIDKDSALTEAARQQQAGGGSLLGLQLRDEQIDEVYMEIEKDLATSRTTLAGLESQRQAMISKYGLAGDKLNALQSLYAKEIEQSRIQMDYELVSKIYGDLATRYEQARLQVASRSTDLQVVDRALPPEFRIAPRRSLSTALATTFGLLGAAALVFLTHYLRLHARHHLR